MCMSDVFDASILLIIYASKDVKRTSGFPSDDDLYHAVLSSAGTCKRQHFT